MTIFLIETYQSKHEKQAEFDALLKEFLMFKKKNPRVFEGVLSWKLLQQEYGGSGSMYIEMWEYENLQEMENSDKKVFGNKEMKRISAEFHDLVEHTTFTRYIWKSVA